MALIWVGTYNGVPPAEAFASTQGFGTPVIVNTATGIGYYYKEGTGVQAINSPGAGGISDHGALTGLGDDDHTQYHNDARGDVRYTPLAHVGSGGAAHSVATPSLAGFLSATDKTKLDDLGDAWVSLILVSDFDATNATPAASPLAFTPDPSKQYIFEGVLQIRTDSSSNAACPGISWPGGLVSGASSISAPTGLSSQALDFGEAPTDSRAVPTGMPANTRFLSKLNAEFLTGASPSGNLAITLSTEV